MALSVIIVLYICIGLLAAAGSIFISQKLFLAKAEQIFFALFLIAIAAFYLAFTAYFGDQAAWRLGTAAVIVFAVFGILGLRLPVVLIIGYSLHGIWDVVHEIHAHGGVSPFGLHELTELPLAYGAFCAAYDWCMAAYFYTRRHEWSAGWSGPPTNG
jgi:hypothetical protein